MKRLLTKRSAILALALLSLTALAAVPSVVSYVGGIPGRVNVEDFGAKPNGIDCTDAYNDAADYLKRRFGGGVVEFGGGTYALLNAKLIEGVSIQGVGMRSGFTGKGVTTLKHANPSAGGSMFRIYCEGNTAKGYTDLDVTIANSTDIVTCSAAHGWSAGQPVKLYPKGGPMPTGGSEIVQYYAGPATNGGAMGGTTLRLYDTAANAITGGSTGVNNFTTDGFVFTAATTDLCSSNPHPFKPGDAVQVASTTTLPAGLSASTTYYVGRPGGTNFYLYTSSGNAITGGATGLVDITDTGTGTHTVYKTTGAVQGLRGMATLGTDQFAGGGIYDCELDGGANSGQLSAPTALQANPVIGLDFSGANTLGDFHIDRCWIHNWDIGVRDGQLGSLSLCINNSEARYNFCAFQVSEQPYFNYCTLGQNYYAIAGRILDANFIGNYIGDNYVGISGYLGYTGRWAGHNSATANAAVTNATFVGCFFFCNKIVGLSLGGNNTVNGCCFVGRNTDTSDGGSVGVRIYDNGNKVTNCMFGEGNAATSFNGCGIMADVSSASTLTDTLIQGNTFYLASCPGIQGGNTQLGIYGTGAYGAISQWSVVGNNFRILSHRCIDVRAASGVIANWHISDNRFTNLPSGSDGRTAQLATTDALIEGQFRYSTISNNYFHKNGGLSTARGFTSTWGSANSSQIIGNRFEGWTSTNQNINIAAGGGDALTQISMNWLTGGGISVGATDSTIKADNIGP
jgi:hypothetical protein